jgi:hypothetical protein
MTAGGYNRKVDSNQRHQLLQIYLHMGLAESRVLCLEYGVGADYAAKRASDLGLGHKRVSKSPTNPRRGFWTEARKAKLIELAATRMPAGDIATALGTSIGSVFTFAGRNNIAVVKYTPEVQAVYDARARDRETHRQARDVAANQKKKIAGRQAAMAAGDFSAIAVSAAFTKTSVAYRKQLPPIGEMSKSQLRAMIAEAAANTASLPSSEVAA